MLCMDRRRGGRRWSDHTILPLRRASQLSATVSCWYCDFKFLAFNEPLFRFGRRNSRYLRVWFSIGIGFSLGALLGVTLIVLREFSLAALVFAGFAPFTNSFTGLSSLIAGLNLSFPSMGYLCVSSVICVIVHEFGHALAAASEGVRMEYIAIFWAVLFPGALVAFNHASLQALPRVASLRIYCAGIWHNAAFCAVCALGLFLLPFILSPFYIHGESPMVLDVPSGSPLSGYLSTHNVIFSLDNHRIHTADEWKQVITILTEPSQYSGIGNIEKGYCIPNSLIEKSIHIQFKGNQTYCPNELTAFASSTCPTSRMYNDSDYKNNHEKVGENIYCLDAKDVVKLRKCGYNHLEAPRNRSDCLCSKVESCWSPVQLPDLGWVEITYSSLDCQNHGRSLFSDKMNSSIGENSCLQTFVFVGDLISMARSIHLTSYQPRWSIYLVTLPDVLEKLFTCSFHVSMVLALLNSLPVFFLDGECILEGTLCYFDSLSSRTRRLFLRYCLLLGTFISIYLVMQTLFISVS